MGQIFLQAFLGALAGLLTWVFVEPSFPDNPVDPKWGTVEAIFILTLGGLVGLAVGTARGMRQGGKVHLLRHAGVGLLFGAIGATLGASIGGVLKDAIFPGVTFRGSDSIVAEIPARVIALAPIGLFLGAAIGAGGMTLKRITVGATGGLIGGALGGMLFDPVSAAVGPFLLTIKGGQSVTQGDVPVITGEIGEVARALYAILLGGAVGLFIGIVERITRTAWVRLMLGRNEGKEWIVDGPQTFLGRSESAHVPLFGDPNVAPMHACIVRQGDAYLLMDGGSPMGTGLNGQRVGQAPLYDGAQIQVGSHSLVFMLKQGSAPQRASEALRSQAHFSAGSSGAPAQPYQPPVPAGMPTQAVPSPSMPTQVSPPMAVSGSMPTQVVTPAPAPSASPATHTLVATSGPLTGQRFPVAGSLEAGREASGVSLAFDTSASRRHAAFSAGPAGLQVTDLGSTNGTFVNDQRVQSTTLRAGDTVRIGVTTFRVE
jgi:pSer/pThr/pTyr-binding forkhead associated (FHA) protein